MAIITKIREKSGIAVTVVAISLLLFIIGGDLVGSGGMFGDGDAQSAGEIAGQNVDSREYQQKVDLMRQNYEAQSGKALDEQTLSQIRDQVWNQYIVDYGYQKQFDELGLKVTDDELVDMVQGNHISPQVQQAFTNPTTGVFDKNGIINYLKNLKNLPPEQQAAWADFEQNLRKDRLRQKYENLFIGSSYVTKEAAKLNYDTQTAKINVKYLFVPYYSVSDTSAKVSDEALSQYFEKHKSEYKGANTRSIDYVSFPIVPSKVDSATLYFELTNLAKGLGAAENDSAFARMNSDIQTPVYQSLSSMSTQLRNSLSIFKLGGVYGPFKEGSTYYLYKYGGTKKDTLFTARASHILIRPENQSDTAKKSARTKALGLLRQIRRGANFEALATANSADQGSAQNGGDLGYFQNNGSMVKPFEQAVFNFKGTGLVKDLVESQVGYHIIKITEPKSDVLYKISTIAKIIAPSQETRDSIYAQADEFASRAKTRQAFDTSAKNEKLPVKKASRVEESSSQLNEIENAREVIRWAFAENTETDGVSPIFETETDYVVAVVVGKTDRDEVKMSDFKDEITAKVRNELKSKSILSQLKNLTGDLEARAKKYGAGAIVETSNDLTLATGFLTGAGFDPLALGFAFGLKKDAISQPIVGESGVFVMQLLSKTDAPKIADYTQYKNELKQKESSSIPYILNETIKDHSKIVDDRAKFL